MKTGMFLFAVICFALFFSGKAHAEPQCDDGYALCMPACATHSAPERCMQRCQEAAARCAKSGVFRMPVGFLLNRRRVEELSRAEGELPKLKSSPKKRRTSAPRGL